MREQLFAPGMLWPIRSLAVEVAKMEPVMSRRSGMICNDAQIWRGCQAASGRCMKIVRTANYHQQTRGWPRKNPLFADRQKLLQVSFDVCSTSSKYRLKSRGVAGQPCLTPTTHTNNSMGPSRVRIHAWSAYMVFSEAKHSCSCRCLPEPSTMHRLGLNQLDNVCVQFASRVPGLLH